MPIINDGSSLYKWVELNSVGRLSLQGLGVRMLSEVMESSPVSGIGVVQGTIG